MSVFLRELSILRIAYPVIGFQGRFAAGPNYWSFGSGFRVSLANTRTKLEWVKRPGPDPESSLQRERSERTEWVQGEGRQSKGAKAESGAWLTMGGGGDGCFCAFSPDPWLFSLSLSLSVRFLQSFRFRNRSTGIAPLRPSSFIFIDSAW